MRIINITLFGKESHGEDKTLAEFLAEFGDRWLAKFTHVNETVVIDRTGDGPSFGYHWLVERPDTVRSWSFWFDPGGLDSWVIRATTPDISKLYDHIADVLTIETQEEHRKHEI